MITTLLLAALHASPALAQEAAAPAPRLAGGGPVLRRDMRMEVNFRGRWMAVPSSIMDIWYFDSDDEGANIPDRPRARAYALGVEYVLKPRPINWIFYYEYVGNLLDDGYWDDVEEPAQHDDGDWIAANKFGMHVIGANFGHELPLTDDEKQVWLSLMFGAGLGIGIVQGELTQWHNGTNTDNAERDCLPQSAAYDRYSNCKNDGAKRVPGVLPMVDLSGAARVNFGDRSSLRIDFGIHDMLYVGGAVGGAF